MCAYVCVWMRADSRVLGRCCASYIVGCVRRVEGRERESRGRTGDSPLAARANCQGSVWYEVGIRQLGGIAEASNGR